MPLSPPDHVNDIEGDSARQAIHALKGYAYQLYASAIAWLELRGNEQLHLEVAEDYAVATDAALNTTQVKASSRTVTLGSQAIAQFLDSFVQLTLSNPGRTVTCRYLSTAEVGVEQAHALRVGGQASLAYWRVAAAGADVGPLRAALNRVGLAPQTHAFFAECDDNRFRDEVLRRIHWDCGAPGLPSMREELDQLLLQFGWDHCRLPSAEAMRLSGPVIEQLLVTCTTQGHRRLTRADLKVLVDEHTRVSVNRADADRLMAQEAGPFAAVRRLVPEDQLGMPAILTTRDAFTQALAATIGEHGLALVLGGSGMGKTIAARLAARATPRSWAILDLRDMDAGAAAARLRETLGELGEPGLGGVLVDDINQLDDLGVARAFAQLLHALRRRDLLACATLYSRPGVRVLGELGVTSAALVEVPNLTVEEVEAMVSAADGDPATWAAPVYRRSDGGHPQLVQASIVGLSARGWNPAELAALAPAGGGLADVADERAATRARLIGSVPEASRALLYRLSLAIGRFDRRAALALGALDPAIMNPGEALDPLVGPWIDAVGQGEFRVSPLLYRAGEDMLGEGAVRAVHNAFSEAIMASDLIDPDKAGAAYVHGLAGRAETALTKIALGIVGAGSDMQRRVARYMTSLRLTQTSRPIFPENMHVSGLLRLAQLIVCLHTGTDDEISKVWKALWREKDAAVLNGSAARFETMVLSKLLLSDRACRAVPEWLDLILRLDTLGREDAKVGDLIRELETSGKLRSAPTVIGMLFMMQAGKLPGVAALVALFERLDALDGEMRGRLLAEYSQVPSEFALLVNNAWLAEHHAGTIDAEVATSGFHRISALAESWGYGTLAARAKIAVAIMQDEYGHDSEAALKTLAEGEARLGHPDHFGRAVAKVLYRRDDYAGALVRIEALDPDFAKSDHIESAYLCREAGICAMHLERFVEAASWFSKAREAAVQVPSGLMRPTAIGLRADAAYAAYRDGGREQVFKELAATLGEIEGLLPLTSLRATHCYKVFGHLLLSIDNDASHDFDNMIEGIDLLPPGCCSNPEPNEGIRDLPQAPLESLWYLLAEAAARFHVDAGIGQALQARIDGKPLVTMEMRLRDAHVSAAIERQDDAGLCAALRRWVDLRVYLPERFAEIQAGGLTDPLREPIPEASPEQLTSEVARDAAEDVLFVHCVVRILGGSHPPLAVLLQAWREQLTPDYPGIAFLTAVCEPQAPDLEPRLCYAQILGRIAQGGRFGARDLFVATVRLVEKASRLASFQREATLPIDRWIATEWHQMISTQRFSLLTPALTIPPIEQALARAPSLARAASIALAAEASIGSVLSLEFRDYFARLAGSAQPDRL
ncbi:MAG: hypothetical protein RIA72_07035 [Sphingopyxis sp.]|uniref:hypothetical protein n=1 Tax=Sphingopyxis sp. TaxID=1908224 RepID=UPI0032EBCE09